MPGTQTKSITISTVQYRGSDLLMAFSDDLPGLLVPGRTQDELKRKLPDAIREIFEAQGCQVISVTTTWDPVLPQQDARLG